jgi:hypothetical protein
MGKDAELLDTLPDPMPPLENHLRVSMIRPDPEGFIQVADEYRSQVFYTDNPPGEEDIQAN